MLAVCRGSKKVEERCFRITMRPLLQRNGVANGALPPLPLHRFQSPTQASNHSSDRFLIAQDAQVVNTSDRFPTLKTVHI